MKNSTVIDDLKNIAENLPESASYSDVMYELYVRMKIAKGKKAAEAGKVVSHDEVKKRFIK